MVMMVGSTKLRNGRKSGTKHGYKIISYNHGTKRTSVFSFRELHCTTGLRRRRHSKFVQWARVLDQKHWPGGLCDNLTFGHGVKSALVIIIIIIIITDLYSAFRSEDTEALGAAQED